MRILNASPGFRTQLTEEEIKNFLGNSKLNIHIGTIDNKGDPNIHPTWYYFDVTNNKFYIETSNNYNVQEVSICSTEYYKLQRNLQSLVELCFVFCV